MSDLSQETPSALERLRRLGGLPLAGFLLASATLAQVGVVDATHDETTIAGERLDSSAFGPGVIESMETVMARERLRGDAPEINPKGRNGSQGTWVVPSRRWTRHPHSGERCVMNKWGDTRMGIGFGAPVDVAGAWFAGQGAEGAWTSGIQVIGYAGGVEVARTDWLEGIGAEPAWLAFDLESVDRIVIASRPKVAGGGWYAMDDLTFTRRGVGASARSAGETVVVDFEDSTWGASLTGSNYRGLDWEKGTGDFKQDTLVIPPPQAPPGIDVHEDVAPESTIASLGGSATSPILGMNFAGPRQGDAGAGFIPPDTCGSVGLNHFVSVVNANLSVYVKATGARVVNTSLSSFWGAGVGDPRVVFDPHSNRFILCASDFSTKVYIAISLTSDPSGSWYKNSITVSQGSDASSWPDYQTLGVDQNGIYTAAYMVGGVNGMSIFAIDKAPLLLPVPVMGTVTAWRSLPWEGAIQPCVTYGTPSGEYFVSRRSSTLLRIRRVNPPLTAPTLTEVGSPTVPSHGSAPDAPALGSTTNLDTIDYRPMNAVYRNGSVWTAHNINVSSRAAVRWYEIAVSPLAIAQVGTIDDPVRSYFMGSIAVNATNDVTLGFSGSSASQWAGSYFAGRLSSDPVSQVSVPIEYKAGLGAYEQTDGGGANRWGDYSLTSVDPTDDHTFWTIQEYPRAGNSWGTWIAQLEPGCAATPDCNGNSVDDACDIESGFSLDNNNSGIPDECEGFNGFPYCFGDGTGPAGMIACPCLNGGEAGRGCANSNELLLGAHLTVSGTTTPNTLLLTCDGIPNNNLCTFLRGTVNNATGAVFGDGIKCVEGALVRFGSQTSGQGGNPSNTVEAPTATISAGSTRYYQLQYRNPAPTFCPPGLFNVSNGWEITW